MKIAIHRNKVGFAQRWINYCEEQNISYKLVNCYANDIISQLQDCDGLMWQHSHRNPKDLLIAKQVLFALEHSGFKVFPDFNTNWHFDDKLAQKYLLEATNVPLVPSYVFFDKKEALAWVNKSKFPKVFKLSGGAGSSNVKLVNTVNDAKRTVRKAFGTGFLSYNPKDKLLDSFQKYLQGNTSFTNLLKSFVKVLLLPYYAMVSEKEKGYVYFQDYLPGNDSDTRIIVIDGKAFALKRMVRNNDFRASGSGNFKYERVEFDERCVQIAFDLTKKLKAQCLAYDFVFDRANNPLIVEISYGFVASVYDPCPGYWDESLNWHEGSFNPYGWMVELMKKKG